MHALLPKQHAFKNGVNGFKYINKSTSVTTVDLGEGAIANEDVNPQQVVYEELKSADIDINDYRAVCNIYNIEVK